METLPRDYFLKEHNREFYVNEKIHKALHFLDLFPLVQNETGEFAQYITDANADAVTSDPVAISEGVDFSEISFGKPSEKRGATAGRGFKFSWTDKVERQGRLNANMQIMLSKAVSRLAIYYDKVFADGLLAGAAATSPSGISDWADDTIAPIQDEILILDAFEADEYGFKATDIYLSRADFVARQLYLSTLPSYMPLNPEVTYHNLGTALPTGTALALDKNTPVASIEKYASPKYSTIREAEIKAEQAGKELKNVPQSFINVYYPPETKPEVHECYLWVEANVNVLEGKGVMQIDLTGE